MTAPDWQLFTRWCRATGRTAFPATTETVHAFVVQLPAASSTVRRRMASIREVHTDDGFPDPWPTAARTYEPAGLPGWEKVAASEPRSVRGCRTRLLVTLLGVGVSRGRVAELTVGDVAAAPDWSVAAVRLAETDDPNTCPRCALTAWLTLLPDVFTGRRLTAADTALGLYTAEGHVCVTAPPDGWQVAPAFLPALDQHGWASYTGISVRSVKRLAHAVPVAAGQPPHRSPAELPERVAVRVHGQVQLDDAFTALEAETDTVIDRVAELTAELDRLTAQLMRG